MNKSKDKPKPKLTERELKELMGVNRDTYKKVRGKWRQR